MCIFVKKLYWFDQNGPLTTRPGKLARANSPGQTRPGKLARANSPGQTRPGKRQKSKLEVFSTLTAFRFNASRLLSSCTCTGLPLACGGYWLLLLLLLLLSSRDLCALKLTRRTRYLTPFRHQIA